MLSSTQLSFHRIREVLHKGFPLNALELVNQDRRFRPLSQLTINLRKQEDSNLRTLIRVGSLANCWFKPLTHTSGWYLARCQRTLVFCLTTIMYMQISCQTLCTNIQKIFELYKFCGGGRI